MKRWSSVASVCLLSSCLPAPQRDTLPPQLVQTLLDESSDELVLTFQEPVSQAEVHGSLEPPAKVKDREVRAHIPPSAQAGAPYLWTASIEDSSHNLSVLGGRYYGPNHDPCVLRLNELRINGTRDHPDFIELIASAPGNVGGWTIDIWGPDLKLRRVILASRIVKTDDLLVVRFPSHKDDGDKDSIPSQTLVTQDTSHSGLSSSRGLIVLRKQPDSAAVDAFTYGEASDRLKPLRESLGLSASSVSSGQGSTATRTWNRIPGDLSAWHLCGTGKASPGRPNSTKVWTPPPSNRSSLKGSSLPAGHRTTKTEPARPSDPAPMPSLEPADSGSNPQNSTDDEGETPSAPSQTPPRNPRPPGRFQRFEYARHRGKASPVDESGSSEDERAVPVPRPEHLQIGPLDSVGTREAFHHRREASRLIYRDSLSIPTVLGWIHDPENPTFGRDSPQRNGGPRKCRVRSKNPLPRRRASPVAAVLH